jgi:hypothetical protein
MAWSNTLFKDKAERVIQERYGFKSVERMKKDHFDRTNLRHIRDRS